MGGESAASSDVPPLTVALSGHSAQILADHVSIIQDLQFVMDCCKRLLTELAEPEEDRDPVLPQALWSAALLAYARCFGKGKQFGLTTEDVRTLPLHGEVMKFHNWIAEECLRFTTRPADPFDAAKVAAALSSPEDTKRRVEGIAVLSARHVLVDGAGVRQLGALASELAKQTAKKAQEQQDVVLADAQRLDIDSLYELPPLPMRWPPADQ
jgi:hypothetical protein